MRMQFPPVPQCRSTAQSHYGQWSTSQTALDHTDNGLCLICDANLDFPSNNLYS